MWHVWQILYLAAWLCLLVHCLRRRRFFPILGAGWSTKLFWLATFLFFNPVLTLLYLIFGVLLPPLAPSRRHPIARAASILAIVLIAATLVFFELPALGKPAGPVTVGESDGPEHPDKKGLTFEASAGRLESSNNFDTSTFSSQGSNARLSVASILILCQDEHPLLDKTARLLQEQLAALPYVRQVTYYPPSETVAMRQVLPDVFILLAVPRIDETRLPAGRKLSATITCNAGRTLYPGHSHSTYANSPPVINFGMESTLQHESRFTGIESRQARYKQQAEDIAKQIGKNLTEQFDKWKDKHGLMPELPDYLYGLSLAPPQLPFVQGDLARTLLSGGGLLLNNHTAWMFADDRPTLEVLKDCRDQLIPLGWSNGRELDNESEHLVEGITMSRGDEHVTVFRQRRRDVESGRTVFEDANNTAERMPMIANYQSLFTTDQMDGTMNRLLDSDVDIETILIFERFIRSDALKQRLLSRIERAPVPSMRGCLTLAEFYANNKQPEKAAAAFMRARALARTEKEHNPEAQRFKETAKRLGDETLARADIEMKHFTEAGFIDLTHTTEPVTVEKGANEPAAFCVVDDNGKIITTVLRLQPTALKHADQFPQYDLVKIVKTENSSSIGTSSLSGHTWVHVQDYGGLDVTIEPPADERFRFTVNARPN